MLPPDCLRSLLRAKLFRPFRMKAASGETFDVRHPELLGFQRNYLELERDGNGPVLLSLMLLETVRPLSASAENLGGQLP